MSMCALHVNLYCSFVVLAGDLNYRTDVENATARELVKAKDLDALLSYDQVIR